MPPENDSKDHEPMNVAPKLGSTRSEAALVLVAALVSIYAISQFLRNSIGVIANDLARELDLTATQTGLLSSAFFFAFAAVQIPIGILIDRYGPKRTMLGTAVLTVLGTVLFALASSASILIAAEAYQTALEGRFGAVPAPPAEAAARLQAEVRSGRLNGEAVKAVLAAAGHRVPIKKTGLVAGLTNRELDILRLAASGLLALLVQGAAVLGCETEVRWSTCERPAHLGAASFKEWVVH